MSDQFLDGDVLGLQPWMQLRHVATGQNQSVSRSYDATDGTNKNDLLQTLDVAWTNNTPLAQWVYGMTTKSGSRVTLQCRSRGYVSTGHAIFVGTTTPVLEPIEVSRFGVGADVGNGGILNLGGAYAINELRQNSVSTPLMPHITGWYLVAPGETVTARIQTRFISENWENTMIDGGDGNTEATVITGDLRLDLFAVPAIATPAERATPTIVNYTYDREAGLGGVPTQVAVPAGLVAGDILLAVVCNNQGAFGAVGPVESGWEQLHDRRAGVLGGELDVHMRIYIRTVTGSEPATYSFTNPLLAEQTSVLIGLHNAAVYSSSFGWHAASNVSSWKLVEEQKAPSIGAPGQLLICLSYFAHIPLQAPITQTPPTGMTELADLPGGGSTLAIAYLTGPPNPTRDRTFTPSQIPSFTGHSITASILVPGD